jgi:hypothetical protein
MEIEVDRASLRRIVRALDEEDDGKHLRLDLARELRRAGDDAAKAAKASIMEMRSGGLPHAGEPLRAAVAKGVIVSARLSGAEVGVKIRARRTSVRGFMNAPRRLNNPKGWRHPVYGDRENWVDQVGKPGWFDLPIRARRDQFFDAVREALQAMADRIGRRIG